MTTHRTLQLLVLLSLFAAGNVNAADSSALDTELVSQAMNAPVPWDIADAGSALPFVSADGSTAIFTSYASNLIPGQQANRYSKPYRFRASTGEVSPIGVEPNADLTIVSMSDDGKWVGLLTKATNLVEGTGFGRPPLPAVYPDQPYLLNADTGEYRRLASRAQHVLVSPDGSKVALSTLVNRFNTQHVLIHDLVNNSITDITPLANNLSSPVKFTADSTQLAFISRASNLAEPPTPYGGSRAYLYDFNTQNTELLARDAQVLDMSINADATEVVLATRLVDLVTGERAPNFAPLTGVLLNRTTGVYSYLLPIGPLPVTKVDMSADGRRISFVTSEALIAGDTNSAEDVYLLDRNTGAVQPVTAQALEVGRFERSDSRISTDGSVVALNVANESYLYTIATSGIDKISSVNGDPLAWSANGESVTPKISADGQLITFISRATNLVADDTNGAEQDVFAFSRNQGSIELLSRELADEERVSLIQVLSDNGQKLAYVNARSDLRLLDRSTGSEQLLLQANSISQLDISSDGRFLVANAFIDNASGVYLFDTQAGTRQLIVPITFRFRQLLISGDGSVVLFSSTGQNFVDDYPNPGYFREEFFSWDVASNEIKLLVPGGLDAIAVKTPALSYDGRYVVFSSDECYQFDRETQFVTRVFASRQSLCDQPDLSRDRRYMVFSSPANDLVSEGNAQDTAQLYVYDALDDTVALLTPFSELEPRGASSLLPVISADGSTIAYQSTLESLAPDGNNLSDVFVVDNPLVESEPDTGTLSFTATLRANSRIVDLNATWPAEAQFTQVREVDVPGGVLWEGSALSFSGEFEVPAGVEQVTFNSRYFVDNVAFGSTTIQLVLTNPEPPVTDGETLEGFVWLDANADARRDDEEPGEVGRFIEVYRCGPPWGIAGSATSVAPLGRWQVTGLEPGEYQIGTQAAGVEFSPLTNDNMVYPNGFSSCVTVDGSQQEIGMGLLRGEADRISVRGTAWLDGNSDGVNDPTEPGDADRVITVYRCEAPWGSVGSAVSDADGNFEISGLLPAEYQIGVAANGGGYSPLGNDNDVFANGFSSCIDFTQSDVRVGIGVLD